MCISRVQSDGKRSREAELVGTRASYMHVLACSVTCYLDGRIEHQPQIFSAPREVHDRKKISIHVSQKHPNPAKKAPSAPLRRASCTPNSKENIPSRIFRPPYRYRYKRLFGEVASFDAFPRVPDSSQFSQFSQSVGLGRPLGASPDTPISVEP